MSTSNLQLYGSPSGVVSFTSVPPSATNTSGYQPSFTWPPPGTFEWVDARPTKIVQTSIQLPLNATATPTANSTVPLASIAGGSGPFYNVYILNVDVAGYVLVVASEGYFVLPPNGGHVLLTGYAASAAAPAGMSYVNDGSITLTACDSTGNIGTIQTTTGNVVACNVRVTL